MKLKNTKTCHVVVPKERSWTQKILIQYSISRIGILSILAFFLGMQSCAYYNTFYNAEQYFAEAQKLTRENQLETVSRQELSLYSKAIEKSRKLLQKYPDSKYRDDAQFLIAKAYYFKGDYSIAKKYFEDLASEYKSSPFAREVPLWIGRCLMKVGDLEMAQHEASRVIKSDAEKSLQADAFLMMGEIAITRDSLGLAEKYLEQVIEISPDGFTKAQAQFQIGKMRESQKNYQGALEAYDAVSQYKPSESLKVEAIIRQTNMLKALGLDNEAVEMIEEMLQSEKFVEIRGQLEIELGKLYTTLGQLDQAEAKFISIIENYAREEVAAEADFFLGELYLLEKLNYGAARSAYDDIRKQFGRSSFVARGTERIKQIDRYTKIQTDYVNLQHQLAGLKPVMAENTSGSPARTVPRSRSRGRSNSIEDERNKEMAALEKAKSEPIVAPIAMDTSEVSHADSIQFQAAMDENRYSMAEYLLFEFARVDSTLDVLNDLELGSQDSTIKQRSAYMRYYALGTVRGDAVAAQKSLDEIAEKYPTYFKIIKGNSSENTEKIKAQKDRLEEIATLYESKNYAGASRQYSALMIDSNISPEIRGKACFNYAVLNDHYLYDKESAVEAYSYLLDQFPDDPMVLTAQRRLDILTFEVKADVLDQGEKSPDPNSSDKD